MHRRWTERANIVAQWLSGPGALHNVELFIKQLPALVEWGRGSSEVIFSATNAQTKREATTGEGIDAGRLFCQHTGVV